MYIKGKTGNILHSGVFFSDDMIVILKFIYFLPEKRLHKHNTKPYCMEKGECCSAVEGSVLETWEKRRFWVSKWYKTYYVLCVCVCVLCAEVK